MIIDTYYSVPKTDILLYFWHTKWSILVLDSAENYIQWHTRFITLSLASVKARKQAPTHQTGSLGLMSQILNWKHVVYFTALKNAAEYI